jgi:hypothetical protein
MMRSPKRLSPIRDRIPQQPVTLLLLMTNNIFFTEFSTAIPVSGITLKKLWVNHYLKIS